MIEWIDKILLILLPIFIVACMISAATSEGFVPFLIICILFFIVWFLVKSWIGTIILIVLIFLWIIYWRDIDNYLKKRRKNE